MWVLAIDSLRGFLSLVRCLEPPLHRQIPLRATLKSVAEAWGVNRELAALAYKQSCDKGLLIREMIIGHYHFRIHFGDLDAGTRHTIFVPFLDIGSI